MSYLFITLDSNVSLTWPYPFTEGAEYTVADINDVQAISNNHIIIMPPANNVGLGISALFNNVGNRTFTIKSYGLFGLDIVTLQSGMSATIYVTENFVEAGEWGVIYAANKIDPDFDALAITAFNITSSDDSINISDGNVLPPGGTIDLVLPAPLTNIANINAPGFITNLTSGGLTPTFAARTFTYNADVLRITYPDGVIGNPYFDFAQSVVIPLSLQVGNMTLSGDSITDTNPITINGVEITATSLSVEQLFSDIITATTLQGLPDSNLNITTTGSGEVNINGVLISSNGTITEPFINTNTLTVNTITTTNPTLSITNPNFQGTLALSTPDSGIITLNGIFINSGKNISQVNALEMQSATAINNIQVGQLLLSGLTLSTLNPGTNLSISTSSGGIVNINGVVIGPNSLVTSTNVNTQNLNSTITALINNIQVSATGITNIDLDGNLLLSTNNEGVIDLNGVTIKTNGDVTLPAAASITVDNVISPLITTQQINNTSGNLMISSTGNVAISAGNTNNITLNGIVIGPDSPSGGNPITNVSNFYAATANIAEFATIGDLFFFQGEIVNGNGGNIAIGGTTGNVAITSTGTGVLNFNNIIITSSGEVSGVNSLVIDTVVANRIVPPGTNNLIIESSGIGGVIINDVFFDSTGNIASGHFITANIVGATTSLSTATVFTNEIKNNGGIGNNIAITSNSAGTVTINGVIVEPTGNVGSVNTIALDTINSSANSGNITIDTSGNGAVLINGISIEATGNITATSSSLDINAIDVVNLTVTGNINADDITITGNTTLDNLTVDAITATGNLPITTPTGNVVINSAVTIESDGDIVTTAGIAVGGNIVIDTGSELTTPQVDTAIITNSAANGNLAISAPDGNVTITSEASGNVVINTVTFDNDGDITTTGNIASNNIAVNDVTANDALLTGNLTTNNITSNANANLTISANNNAQLSLNSVTITNGIDITTTGDLDCGGITTGAMIATDIELSGNLVVEGNITGNIATLVTANITGNVSIGDILTTANIDSGAGNLTVNNITVTPTGDITTSGDMTGNNATITSNLDVSGTITGNIVNITTGTISGSAIVQGTLTTANIDSGTNNLTVNNVTVTPSGNITTTGNLNISDINGNDITLTGNITATNINATTEVNTPSITNNASNGNVAITSNGTGNVNINTVTIASNGDVDTSGTITAANFVSPGTAVAWGYFQATGTGDPTLGQKFNISSVVVTGTAPGTYQVTFTNAPTSLFVVTTTIGGASGGGVGVPMISTVTGIQNQSTNFYINIFDVVGNPVAPENGIMFVVFGTSVS